MLLVLNWPQLITAEYPAHWHNTSNIDYLCKFTFLRLIVSLLSCILIIFAQRAKSIQTQITQYNIHVRGTNMSKYGLVGLSV